MKHVHGDFSGSLGFAAGQSVWFIHHSHPYPSLVNSPMLHISLIIDSIYLATITFPVMKKSPGLPEHFTGGKPRAFGEFRRR
jgi:hypothetical protein